MDVQAAGTGFEFRDYLHVLNRRKWIVILVTIVAVGVAIAVSLTTTPRYRATGKLLIAPRLSETLFSPGSGALGVDPRRAVATAIEVLQSGAVAREVSDQLGAPVKILAVGSPESDVVAIQAVNTDPGDAAQIVNLYAQTYIRYRQESTLNEILAAQAEVQRKIAQKQTEIEALDAATSPREDPKTLERTGLLNQQNLFRNQLDQLQVAASLNSGGAQLITPAIPPDEPFDPRPVRTTAFAGVLGLLIGIGCAFVYDYLDDTIRAAPDIARVATDLPVLGLIPTVAGWRNGRNARTITQTDPTSGAAEAYRSLRTSVQFLGLDSPLKLLQVTSPSSAEGKTTTLANLAVALASTGQNVIAVDCDLRRSRLHEFFALANDVGFTSVLLGAAPLSRALQDVPGVPGLRLLAAGPRPPNPSELLAGGRALDLLATLGSRADIVLIDSPPALPVSDAIGLAANVDAVLMVVRASKTHRRQLGPALGLLRQVDARIVGAVLNSAKHDLVAGYHYGYSYEWRASEAWTATERTSPARPLPVLSTLPGGLAARRWGSSRRSRRRHAKGFVETEEDIPQRPL